MSVIAVIALLRLIPYAIVLYIAVKKGFRWLAATMVYLFIVVFANLAFHPDPTTQQVLGSFFALLILMHALDLKDRNGVKR